MFQRDKLTYEADKGQSILGFARELFDKRKTTDYNFIGRFNDIDLDVNERENKMSLYWQYMYKDLLRKK